MTTIHASRFLPLTIITTLLLISFLAVTPASASSGATRATMIEINSTTTAFVLTYEYGFLNRTLTMPGTAMQSGSRPPVTTHPPIVYTLRDSNGATTTVNASAALVWGTASSADGVFSVPGGKREQFSLIVLTSHNVNAQPDHLTIDTLAFTLTDEDGTAELSQLPPTDMAKFTTKGKTESSYISTPIAD